MPRGGGWPYCRRGRRSTPPPPTGRRGGPPRIRGRSPAVRVPGASLRAVICLLRILEQSLQSPVHSVGPEIECVEKRRSRVAFRDPVVEQPRTVGFASHVAIDGIADQRLFACPEPVVDRDTEPRPCPVLADRPEIDRQGPHPCRYNGSPASVDELDEGLDVRLLDRIVILRYGHHAGRLIRPVRDLGRRMRPATLDCQRVGQCSPAAIQPFEPGRNSAACITFPGTKAGCR